MSKIRNIVRILVIIAIASILAAFCTSPATALAGGVKAEDKPSQTVSDLARIADGYDAGASGMAFEIEIPLP